MEFFKIIDKQVTQEIIQDKIYPQNVEDFTETMLFIEDHNNDFKGLTLWGDFLISYDKINGGVRFTLKDCPNGLSWTITTGYPPDLNKIVLHSTINRTQKPEEFLDEIQEFMDGWVKGIKENF